MGEALGIDLGGTKVSILRVAEDGTILDRTRISTPHGGTPEEALALIAEAARPLIGESTQAVGIGAAGLIGEGGVMRFGPNLGWREVPMADLLSTAFALPVMVDNDANVAAWGEFRVGAGRDIDHLLCVTVGTGIGGGIVFEGKLFRGAHGLAAEIGHVIVQPEGPPCHCGNRGCWEQVASGTAIQRAGRAYVAAGESGRLSELAGGDAETVDGPMVTRAAHEGDRSAIDILAIVGARLGEGIAGLVNILDPDAVIVGGGASEAGPLLLNPARAAFLTAVEAPEHRPEVPLLLAALGNDAGAIGAALLAMDGPSVVWGTST